MNNYPSYPQAPPPRRPKFVVPLVIGGLALFALIVFGVFTAFKGGMRTTQAATVVADKFFSSMSTGQYANAYGMLDSQLQSTTSPAEMKDLQDLIVKRHGPVTYKQQPSWFVNTNNGVTTVTLNYQAQYAGGSKPVNVVVVDTPAGMKIYGYHYN
jgi:hypothetical protein